MAEASFSWPIEKYARFVDQWTRVPNENISLHIHFDQMYISSGNTIIDTMKLKNIKKAFLKEQTLLIIHEHEGLFRKIKMLFSCCIEEIKNLMGLLRLHCSVHNVEDSQSPEEPVTTFQEMFKAEMERQTNSTSIGSMFPHDFPFEEFLKMCIMDPDFPYFVDQVEKNLDPFLQ